MSPLHFPTTQYQPPKWGLSDGHSPGRALRDGELFEIVIQKMVDRWSGSIEAGEGHVCVCVYIYMCWGGAFCQRLETRL